MIGVASEKWGEEAKAIVTLAESAAVSAEMLDRHLRPLLAGYKIPKSLDFVAELLLTAPPKSPRTSFASDMASPHRHRRHSL